MKKSKEKTPVWEDGGKLLLDLGKLVFGSIFLGGVLRGELPQAVLLIGGIVVAVAFCSIGLWVVSKRKTEKVSISPVQGGHTNEI